MKAILRISLVLAITLALALAGVGCSASKDQTAEANAAIEAANKQVDKFTAASSDLEAIMKQTESLSMDKAGAKKGIELTDQAQAKIEEQMAAAAAAKAEFTKVKALQVDEDLKKYADMEIGVVEAVLSEAGSEKATVGEMRKLYDLVVADKATEAAVGEIGKKIEAEAAKLTAAEEQVTKLEEAAQKFFEEKQLGDK